MVLDFNTFIKESIWSNINKRSEGNLDRKEDVPDVKVCTKNVTNALHRAGINDFDPNFEIVKCMESEFISSIYNEIGDYVDVDENVLIGYIEPKEEILEFNYDDMTCKLKGIYVSDGIIINDINGTANLWIEFDYIDDMNNSSYSSTFYYSTDWDCWSCDDLASPTYRNCDDWLKKLLVTITKSINPNTKYTNDYLKIK